MKRLFITLFSFGFILNGFAQRPLDNPASSGCFRHGITPIQIAPTLRSDMSLDCLLGYIYFDSLARTNLNPEQIDSLSHLISSWDTLKPFMRFKYAMKDYDDDLFMEYIHGGIYINNNYKMPPAVVNYYLLSRMNGILGKKDKRVFLTEASVAVRVRITSVYSFTDTLSRLNVPLTCVTATILDTIKGKHIRPCDNGDSYLSENTNTSPCINFKYSSYWIKEDVDRGDQPIEYIDSLGIPHKITANRYSDNAVQVNKEYIIFLKNMFYDYDGASSYYHYLPLRGYSSEGGIFPITDTGYVSIPSNYFGYGTSVLLSTFMNLVQNDIQTIVSH